MKKIDFGLVKEEFNKRGYTLLSEEYVNSSTDMICFDESGYKYRISYDHLRHCESPHFVGKHNPYSIENINTFISNNGSTTKCVSPSFDGCKELLEFQCSCGKIYYQKWPTFQKSRYVCEKCVYSSTYNKIPPDSVIERMNSLGLSVLSGHENELSMRPVSIHCTNRDGYKGILKYHHMLRGAIPAPFHVKNPYTIDNINHYFSIKCNGEYECLSNEYVNNHNPLRILHKKCGRVFEAPWINLNRSPSDNDINRHGTGCPFCTSGRIESIHALVLKQVYKHEVPSVVLEDRTCINPKTGAALPTDLVDHKNKIAIEIQSWFHDNRNEKYVDEYRLWKDSYKKNFWISNGYSFYDPDQRDYTPLGIIQLFFPYISEIPEYVDVGYANKIGEYEVQRILRARQKNPKRKIKTSKCNQQQTP